MYVPTEVQRNAWRPAQSQQASQSIFCIEFLWVHFNNKTESRRVTAQPGKCWPSKYSALLEWSSDVVCGIANVDFPHEFICIYQLDNTLYYVANLI